MSPQEQANFYFAYGSNMNPRRVDKRNMKFKGYGGGILEGYRLAFNKRSIKFPGAASANVVPAPECQVEGVVYRLPVPQEIEVLDPYEGYPVRYRRERLPITSDFGLVDAWVYIANDEFVTHGLKPARWYLEHLLKGRPYMSKTYYAELQRTETLPDSHVEPEDD
ncbi:MAG TPA: gamma-glutamylcyclotransferase family protein [Pseudomonadales bacterium]|nr:gamma-glutamylcyclotransferase family protein [Pseudomonadales bacterium]